MIWLRNIASNYLRFLTSLAAMAVMTPIIIDAIGVDEYGEWAIVFAAIGLVSLSDLGFATAAIKFLAEAAVDSRQRLGEITGSLLAVYSALTVFCGAVVLVLYQADVMAMHGMNKVFLLLGISTTFIMGTSVHRAFLIAVGKQEIVNWITILGTLAQAGLTWKLLSLEMGTFGMALAHALSMSLQALLFTLFAAEASMPRPTFHNLRSHIKTIATFSVWALIANVCFMLIIRVDPLIIEAILDSRSVALYAIALKVGEQVLLLNKQFSNALLPLISQRQSAANRSALAELLVYSTRYLMILATPITVLLAINASDLLRIWIGDVVSGAATSLSILAIAALGSTMQFNAANILGMSGYPKFVALSMTWSAAMKILLGTLLVFEFGIAGAAVGTLIAAFGFEARRNMTKVCSMADIPATTLIKTAVMPGLACTAPVALLAMLDEKATGMLDLFIVNASYGFISLLVFALFFFNEQDRAFFQRFFNRQEAACAQSIAS